MERDFLGLSSKESSHMMKDKSKIICKYSVAEDQWPYSPKLSSASPPNDMISMFSPVGTGFLRDYKSKAPTSLAKKNTWTVPAVDKRISSDSSSKLWNVGSSSTVSSAAATMKQQSNIGGIYVPKPLSFSPPNAFKNRQTLLRNNAKTSTLPAELTIFYSGAVHVYHDISPQKAEAIMHMAGNGSSMTADAADQTSKPIDAENASATFVTGGITMARKATLTRFLEKRKSRLIDARPYNFTEKLLDYITPTPSKIRI